MFAHGRMRGESVHHGIHDLFGERRQVRELRFGVVASLNDQLLALQQFALDDIVHIDEPVVVGEIALEEIIDLLDDLLEPRVRRRSPKRS